MASGGGKLDSTNASSAPTLSNSLNLNGGTLTVEGSVTISGGVTVDSSGSINPTGGTSLTLGPVSGAGTLTLAGQGVTFLAGTLDTTTVSVQGKVKLKSTFGDGSTPGSFLVMEGGELTSLGIGTFTGNVTLQNGTLVAGGINAFGTGSLAVIPTGTVQINLAGGAPTLGNALSLSGGTLGVGAGSLTFSQAVTLGSNTTIQNGGTLTLAGGVSGGGNTLKLAGSGKLLLGGTLSSVTVIVPTQSQFDTLDGLTATGGATVQTANGHVLFPS